MKKLILSEEHLAAMLETELLCFDPENKRNDNAPGTFGRASALLLMILHERETGDGRALERIAAHFESAAAAGNAPAFDAICLWSYCPFSASIALAKATPSVWNSLSDDLRARLTFVMEMYAYLESFATSDDNNYKTGPGLTGNFGKGWNPNYRLANVPAIVFAAHFFGDGDMNRGAAKVNEMLHAFDEAAYDRVIAQMDAFGWNRAKATWTTPGRVHEDGTVGTDARHILLYGGTTYAPQYAHTEVKKDGGDGLGVTNGGKPYLYHGHTLEQAGEIVKDLLHFNYSGGAVKSDHHYDVDKDGEAELVAWILDKSTSPYQGQMGMMKEFASGNRSSTGYCSHDFQLCVELIAAAYTLGICDAHSDAQLWPMICVGNGDFLYKNEIGYQGFATGSYGRSTKTHSEENEGAVYFAVKSLWKTAMAGE